MRLLINVLQVIGMDSSEDYGMDLLPLSTLSGCSLTRISPCSHLTIMVDYMLSGSYWEAAAGDFSEAKGFIRFSTGGSTFGRRNLTMRK